MEAKKLRVKGILFDLDGTIMDSKEAYLEALEAAFESGEQMITDARTVTEIPKRLEQNLSIEDLIKGMDVHKFLKTYLSTYYRVTFEKAKPIPRVAETLEKLSKKAKLALITMRYVPKENVIRELEKHGLAKHFQYVITALDTENPKPSPEALIKCAMQLNVEMCDCVVVGDSVADIRAGKNAGARTVGVFSGIFSRIELEKENPDLILENVNKLPDFIE